MNERKLKAKLVECNVTYADCSKILNVTKCTFSKKMNNQSPFTLIEVKLLKDYLSLTDEEIKSIFLD